MFNRLGSKNNLLPCRIVTISAESLTIPAGAIGTVVNVPFSRFPVLSNTGTKVGGKGDTSHSFGTGTCFTTEVEANQTDSELANGEYWIDYPNGVIHGRKATNAVADTVTYKTLVVNTAENFVADAENNVYDMFQISSPIPNVGSEDKWPNLFDNALVKSKIISAEPGVLKSLLVRLDATLASGTYYIHIGNHASLPANGAVNLLTSSYPVIHTLNTPTIFAFDFGLAGRPASVGITAWISTTDFTKTLIGSDCAVFDADYVSA